jgi:uncharacterized protein
MAKSDTKAASGEDQSMEEILQSIRRIIAEDGEGEAVPAAPAPVFTETPKPSEDILELTDMVMEDGAVVAVEKKETAPAEPIDIDALFDSPAPAAESDDVLKNIDAMVPAPAVAPPNFDTLDSLLSQPAAQAASQAFKSLKKPMVEAPFAPVDSAAFRSGATVEDLMMELMRPMLKSWLDTNLPSIVERIVEREVRKLTQ